MKAERNEAVKSTSLTNCSVSFELPAGFSVYNQKEDSILAVRSDGSQLTAMCMPNHARTSRVDSIYKELSKSKESMAQKYSVQKNIPAVMYSRSRIVKGRKIHVVELYVALRDYEYIFAFFGPGSDEQYRSNMLTVVNSIQFAEKLERTISEESYLFRLNVLRFVSIGLAGMLFYFLLRWLKRRKKPEND